jgi:aspartyl-tRNA(Asn)/glutamyl-tRNA(Gln) amidotransferase subunit C
MILKTTDDPMQSLIGEVPLPIIDGFNAPSYRSPMPITRADVEKIAQLARVELTSEETESFTGQLSSIISYIDKLNEIDTANVPPMSHSSTATGDNEFALRDDVNGPSLGAELATENAPDPEAGYFKVPRVI